MQRMRSERRMRAVNVRRRALRRQCSCAAGAFRVRDVKAQMRWRSFAAGFFSVKDESSRPCAEKTVQFCSECVQDKG